MIAQILKVLDWLGRQGTRAIAISLVLGMVLPPLSAVLKPLIPQAVFVLLLIAFLRVDAHAVSHRLKRPWLVIAVVGWMMVVLPLALGLPLLAIGAETWRPGVMVAFIVMAIAPPIMSTPGFAYLLNLDGALSLTVLVAAMIATPVLCPLIAGLLVGDALPISALDMGLRLAVLLCGSLVAALVLRRLIGLERIERSRRIFDGANVVLLFVFAVAIMDGVAVRLVAEPLFVLGLLAAAVGFALTFIVVSALVFRFAGLEQSLTIAISAGNRNMALMAAALAGVIPDASWTFFAVAQVPIYLLPWLTKPVIDRLIGSPQEPTRH
ncbi:sodium:proton symporter [Microbaculum marinum]|uniref:Sodium:proton symporter n=1 Tax=Microbaculum marinum TaxID=1764581 RepID=A0AAW9S3R7_9HYPH